MRDADCEKFRSPVMEISHFKAIDKTEMINYGKLIDRQVEELKIGFGEERSSK